MCRIKAHELNIKNKNFDSMISHTDQKASDIRRHCDCKEMARVNVLIDIPRYV